MSTSFFVDVEICSAVIDSSMSQISNVFYHSWGDANPSTRTFLPFSYTADCALDFTYTAKIKQQDGSLANLPYPEITFVND